MKQVTSTGQTVESAIEAALGELQTTRDQVDITIVEEGKKGFFGLFGSKEAIIKAVLKHDPIQDAELFLHDVIQKMNLDAQVEKIQEGNELTFKLSGEKMALLIGKRGQTLNSLQYLTQLVANKHSNQYYTVVVDAENYRQRRRETIENLADRLAQKAIALKKEVVLEPMPSFERKIIHNRLYHVDKIKTYSDGVEPNRHVVIKPNLIKQKPSG